MRILLSLYFPATTRIINSRLQYKHLEKLENQKLYLLLHRFYTFYSYHIIKLVS